MDGHMAFTLFRLTAIDWLLRRIHQRPFPIQLYAQIIMTYLTYALSLPVEHRPQTIRLHPALSCAACPSSSSCTWNPPSTFHSRAPASMCSSVALFLCGLVLSTAVLAWQCCHHSFWACDKTSSTFFFSAEPTPVPGRSSCIVPYWTFCLASGCLNV